MPRRSAEPRAEEAGTRTSRRQTARRRQRVLCAAASIDASRASCSAYTRTNSPKQRDSKFTLALNRAPGQRRYVSASCRRAGANDHRGQALPRAYGRNVWRLADPDAGVLGTNTAARQQITLPMGGANPSGKIVHGLSTTSSFLPHRPTSPDVNRQRARGIGPCAHRVHGQTCRCPAHRDARSPRDEQGVWP